MLPVIIMSAYSKVFLSLGSYGCDDFIPKPFDLFELVDIVKKQLKPDVLTFGRFGS